MHEVFICALTLFPGSFLRHLGRDVIAGSTKFVGSWRCTSKYSGVLALVELKALSLSGSLRSRSEKISHRRL